jgi:hypothetical protein
MSETKLSKAIREALVATGCWVERVQSGVVPAVKGKRVHYVHCASPGTPDLLLVAPIQGWLEVKTPKGKLSDDQKRWHERAARIGVRVADVRSVRDALETVALWRRDRRAA